MSLFQKILATILVILAEITSNYFDLDYISTILSVLTLLVIFMPVKDQENR